MTLYGLVKIIATGDFCLLQLWYIMFMPDSVITGCDFKADKAINASVSLICVNIKVNLLTMAETISALLKLSLSIFELLLYIYPKRRGQ